MNGDFDTLVALLGRRAALKYFGLGLLAAVVAACDRSTPSGARPSVAALTLDAFAKGTWKVTSTVTRRGSSDAGGGTAELTVGDGRWSAGPGLFFDDYGVAGEYTLDGDRLRVVLRGSEEYRRKYPQVRDQAFDGSGLPKTVPTATFVLGWAMGSKSQTCEVQWDGATLSIVGEDFYGNPARVTATRA